MPIFLVKSMRVFNKQTTLFKRVISNGKCQKYQKKDTKSGLSMSRKDIRLQVIHIHPSTYTHLFNTNTTDQKEKPLTMRQHIITMMIFL